LSYETFPTAYSHTYSQKITSSPLNKFIFERVIIGLHFLQLLTTRREKADDNARYPATRQKK
jgi:hypothetical protein